jgi:hypothetical protein
MGFLVGRLGILVHKHELLSIHFAAGSLLFPAFHKYKITWDMLHEPQLSRLNDIPKVRTRCRAFEVSTL